MIRSLSTFFLVSAAIFISGCSLFYSKPEVKIVKPPYEAMANALDIEYFRTPTGDLIGHYPKDWLLVNTDSVAALENIAAIYTNAERQSAFVVTEIPGTADLRRKVERDGLIAVADESLLLKKKKNPTLSVVKQPEVFVTEGIQYGNYEYQTSADGSDILTHRMVCVSTGIRFYELGIVELHRSSDKMRYKENFRLLQSVIHALEGTVPVRAMMNDK